MRKIEIVKYSNDWSEKYHLERELLTTIIGKNCIKIHHIGSTSIEGLSAKPIIDIMVQVNSLSTLDTKNQSMINVGYLPKGESGIAGRRFYEKGGDNRTHHVHAFETGHHGLIRHLAFRNYLMANPDICDAYAELKKSAAQKCNHDPVTYASLKNSFIAHHEKIALLEYAL